MRTIFKNDSTEGCLLVDASNAFNSLNRRAALQNVSVLCPPLSTVLINTYRAAIRIIVPGIGEILSTEGTTQSDPLALAMYALAIVPLIHKLKINAPDVKQVWYADDATCAGSCEKLRQWWDNVERYGPLLGYYLVPKHILLSRRNMFQKQRISLLTQKFTFTLMACAIWVLHLVQILSLKPTFRAR